MTSAVLSRSPASHPAPRNNLVAGFIGWFQATFDAWEAAMRVSRALENNRRPDLTDLKTLGIDRS